jgi:putative beta barrel porin BBP7
VGVALGDSRQIVNIAGATALFPAAGGAASVPGGILALPSNSGRFVHNNFAVVPELRFQVGYDLFSWLRLGVSYNFLYWSSVVRPGDQVAPVVSASQLPSSPSFGNGASAVPPLPHNTSDFWMQGVTFSMTLRF